MIGKLAEAVMEPKLTWCHQKSKSINVKPIAFSLFSSLCMSFSWVLLLLTLWVVITQASSAHRWELKAYKWTRSPGKHTEKRKGSGNKSQTTEMETPSQVWAGWTGSNIRENFTVAVTLELNLRGWGLPGSEDEDKVFEQSEQRKEHLQRLIGCKGQHVNLENQQVISVWLEHKRVCVCVFMCVQVSVWECICVFMWLWICVQEARVMTESLEGEAGFRSLKTVYPCIRWYMKNTYRKRLIMRNWFI